MNIEKLKDALRRQTALNDPFLGEVRGAD